MPGWETTECPCKMLGPCKQRKGYVPIILSHCKMNTSTRQKWRVTVLQKRCVFLKKFCASLLAAQHAVCEPNICDKLSGIFFPNGRILKKQLNGSIFVLKLHFQVRLLHSYGENFIVIKTFYNVIKRIYSIYEEDIVTILFENDKIHCQSGSL